MPFPVGVIASDVDFVWCLWSLLFCSVVSCFNGVLLSLCAVSCLRVLLFSCFVSVSVLCSVMFMFRVMLRCCIGGIVSDL